MSAKAKAWYDIEYESYKFINLDLKIIPVQALLLLFL